MQFEVNFSSVARILVYKDGRGQIEFSFDFPGDKSNGIILEAPGNNNVEKEWYDLAAARAREFLTSKGYKVQMWP